MIIIDFIIKLSKSKDLINNINYNNIFIIVERFTKYNKFIPINESHSTEDLTDIIIRKVINNHRLPDEFVIDRNTIFTLHFFIILIVKLKVNNKFSIVFHLQTDG